MDLDSDQAQFEYEKAFTGCELVHDTHRLALMNAMLHEIEGKITLGDTLSPLGKNLDDYDVVLLIRPLARKKAANARPAMIWMSSPATNSSISSNTSIRVSKRMARRGRR